MRALTARFWAWAEARRERLVTAAIGPARPPAPPSKPLELTPAQRAAIRRAIS